MKSRFYLSAVAALFLMLFVAFSLADVIVLKDGTRVEGRIVREDNEEIEVEFAHGSSKYKKSDVKEIVRCKTPLEEYEEKIKSLDDNSAAVHEEIAQWCEKKGLLQQEEKHKKRARTLRQEAKIAEGKVSLCPDCKGDGIQTCSRCVGVGSLMRVCAGCRGFGKLLCPNCEGKGKFLCRNCYGSGKVESGGKKPTRVICETCDGKGTMKCEKCRGEGTMKCPRCDGAGKEKTTCPSCAGKRTVICDRCRGDGLVAKGTEEKPVEIPDLVKRYSAAVVTVKTEEAIGTGFIVDLDGNVLTALHIVKNAEQITVLISTEGLPDSFKKFRAQLVAANAAADIAKLKIDPGKETLSCIKLGFDVNVKAGEEVFTIGNPLGLTHSVVRGTVSSVERSVGAINLLQISAPVNEGNSGGPLFNAKGEVIGMVRAKSAWGDRMPVEGIAWAMPIEYAKDEVLTPTSK